MPNTKEDLNHYRKELSKLEPRVLALQETVRGLEKLLNLETVKDFEIDLTQIEIEPDAFANLTTKDAALKGLFKISSPVPGKQLAEFLERNGFHHESKNFPNTLNTTLDRLKKEAMVVKGAKGWELTDKGEAYCSHQFVMQLQFNP